MKELKDLKLSSIDKLNELNEQELRKEVTSAAKQSFIFRMKGSLGELKQTHLMKALRRYIARAKTIAHQKGFNID